MIEFKWRYRIFIFAIVFISCYTAYIANIDSFILPFFFAVGTNCTIGYGYRNIKKEYLIAGAVICLQYIFGLLIQSFIIGFVIAKMVRPRTQVETIIFSEKAVICLRDGQFCFLCQVGDIHNTHLVQANVRLKFITDHETAKQENELLHQRTIKVGPNTTDDYRPFLIWPTTLCHVIDRDSPLYKYDSNELPNAQLKIIVLLEGIVESTGIIVQAHKSYSTNEILWGYRFKKLITYQRSNGFHQINYGIFNSTYEVKVPKCSPSEFYRNHLDSNGT